MPITSSEPAPAGGTLATIIKEAETLLDITRESGRRLTRSWFTKEQYPVAAENIAARAAGANGRIFANETYADWLVFEHPQLAGRISYDSRFELLTSRQLRAVVEFRSRVNGWRSTIGGYSVLVLDKVEDHQPIRALLRAGEARVLARRGQVVVLQRR